MKETERVLQSLKKRTRIKYVLHLFKTGENSRSKFNQLTFSCKNSWFQTVRLGFRHYLSIEGVYQKKKRQIQTKEFLWLCCRLAKLRCRLAELRCRLAELKSV